MLLELTHTVTLANAFSQSHSPTVTDAFSQSHHKAIHRKATQHALFAVALTSCQVSQQ